MFGFEGIREGEYLCCYLADVDGELRNQNVSCLCWCACLGVCAVLWLYMQFCFIAKHKSDGGGRGIIRTYRKDVKMSQDEKRSLTLKFLRLDVGTQNCV